MKDEDKTKQQLIDELAGLRQRVTDLKASGTAGEQMEEASRESEERYRSIYQNTPVMMHSIDLDGRLVSVNDHWLKVLGYTRSEVIGRKSIEFLTEASRYYATNVAIPEFFKAGMVAEEVEKQFVKKNGEVLDVLLSGVGERDASGEVIRLSCFIIDVTERKRAEDTRRQLAIVEERNLLFEQEQPGREELQALSRRLVELQEAERRKIARDLHDEIGQALTGLKFSLETNPSLPADAFRISLEEARMLVDELMTRVHDLSLDLRPAMLDELGLLPTLLWYFERYTAQTHVKVTFEHTRVNQRFSPEVETAAYRIVQAALTNVALHANVDEVAVLIWTDQSSLCVQVEDQGTGFDPATVAAGGATSGLPGMRERAALLGGRLAVDSAPGAGTRLTAELSLGNPADQRDKSG